MKRQLPGVDEDEERKKVVNWNILWTMPPKSVKCNPDCDNKEDKQVKKVFDWKLDDIPKVMELVKAAGRECPFQKHDQVVLSYVGRQMFKEENVLTASHFTVVYVYASKDDPVAKWYMDVENKKLKIRLKCQLYQFRLKAAHNDIANYIID